MEIISGFHPQYRPPFSTKEVTDILNDVVRQNISEEETQKLISNLYFEARKAVEFRLKKTKGVLSGGQPKKTTKPKRRKNNP